MNKVRLVVIALLAFATALGLHGISQLVQWMQPLELTIVQPGGHVSAAEQSLRPIYPYSVIPGGAYSPTELKQSISRDAVVREHYSDFDLKSARVVTLTADRFQYVSYRIHNKVYWTHGKLRIPKGEVLLTDGTNFCRTRCGNRLSDARHVPYTFPQPSIRVLSLPAFTPPLLARGDVSLPAAAPEAELTEEPAPVDFELPGVAPYVPPAAPLQTNTAENWPPIGITTPPTPISGGYPVAPAVPTGPITPTSPVIPVAPGPPTVGAAAVPEPASLYLFVVALAISLWVITRWVSKDESIESAREEEPK